MATVHIEEHDDRLLVGIGGILDIYAAKDVRAALGPAVRTSRPTIELDVTGVEEVDLAGVQILVWLRTTAQANGVALRVVASGPAVDSAARSLCLLQWQVSP